MESFISLEQFEELATVTPAPPYFLLLVGVLMTLACAVPLVAVIQQRVHYWSGHLSPATLPESGRLQVLLPAMGTTGGIFILLLASFEVVGLPVLPSLLLALVLTIALSFLAWMQLGRVLSHKALRSYFAQSNDFPSWGNAS